MAVITMIREIKKIHPTDVAIIKIGNFYHVYGKDSYIISYLFEYKLKYTPEKIYTCGFPQKALNKVINGLENKKINYIILDRRNNYEVIEKLNNKNLNNYETIYLEAHEYVNFKKRIDNIYSYFVKNINKDDIKIKIKEVEEVLKKWKKKNLKLFNL